MNKALDKIHLILRSLNGVFSTSLILVFLISCSKPAEYNISYSWSPVKVTSEIEKSEEIEAMIDPFRTKLDSIMDEEIGYSVLDLTTQGRYESTLGTFVTKLLYDQSNALYERKVDVSLMNHHGGLRAPINKGPITVGDVFEVMPFENEMLLLEVPGETLAEIIKFVGDRSSSMIWPVSFDVTNAGIMNLKVNGESIDPDRVYILSVSDYQANGGSGFEILKSLKRVDVKPIKLRDMILTEVRESTARGDSIRVEVANAINVIN